MVTGLSAYNKTKKVSARMDRVWENIVKHGLILKKKNCIFPCDYAYHEQFIEKKKKKKKARSEKESRSNVNLNPPASSP